MPLSPKVRAQRRAQANKLKDPKVFKRKRCLNDGNLFRPTRAYPVQKFCSDECRKEFHANGGNAFGPLKTRLEKLVHRITKELERRIKAIEQTLFIMSGTSKGGLLERIEAIERTLSGIAKGTDAEARKFASLMKELGPMESLSRNR